MVAASSLKKDPTRFSPGKVLKRIIDNNISGRLVFQDVEGSGDFWEVFVGQGKLHFASVTQSNPERLNYYLHTDSQDCEWPDIQTLNTYDLICHSWRSGSLPFQKVRQLMLEVTQDALTHILAIPQAKIQFEKELGLDPILLDVPIQEAVSSRKADIFRWRNLRPTIVSPLQCFTSVNLAQLIVVLNDRIQKLPDVEKLEALFADSPNFYRVADFLGLEVLELADLIEPLVLKGAIRLGERQEAANRPQLTIACIDDSKAVQRKVRLTLEAAGYDVLELMEPARALTALVRSKPSAILLDITMPQLSGYELCRMLRQSAALKDVPIIMLTGRDGAIDRLRARMAGSSDYMTKPFNSHDLLSRIQKFTATEVPVS